MAKVYTKETLWQIWQKANIIDSFHETIMLRKDKQGRIICFYNYGDRNHQHGWEVDHIIPVVVGGSDELYNLQPLHWKSNISKADDLPARTIADILLGR